MPIFYNLLGRVFGWVLMRLWCDFSPFWDTGDPDKSIKNGILAVGGTSKRKNGFVVTPGCARAGLGVPQGRPGVTRPRHSQVRAGSRIIKKVIQGLVLLYLSIDFHRRHRTNYSYALIEWNSKCCIRCAPMVACNVKSRFDIVDRKILMRAFA